MFGWIQQFRNAAPQTKYFALNWALYLIVIIVTTVYCYARLEIVRKETQQVSNNPNKNQ